MHRFVVTGVFMATDIDDALTFLARYFTDARDNPDDSIPNYDRVRVIDVRQEDVAATGRAASS